MLKKPRSAVSEKTFQERYYVTEPGWPRRLFRDAALVIYIVRMLWMWLVVGGRVRRDYRRCMKSGNVYRVDHLAKDNY